MKKEKEAVNHPDHYNAHPSGVECIDVVEHMSFNVGNAIKYLWRADEKGKPIEDLKKAAWYINREIERRSSGHGPIGLLRTDEDTARARTKKNLGEISRILESVKDGQSKRKQQT